MAISQSCPVVPALSLECLESQFRNECIAGGRRERKGRKKVSPSHLATLEITWREGKVQSLVSIWVNSSTLSFWSLLFYFYYYYYFFFLLPPRNEACRANCRIDENFWLINRCTRITSRVGYWNGYRCGRDFIDIVIIDWVAQLKYN